MSTLETTAFITICSLAGVSIGLLIIRHLNSKAWQSIAKEIKEDFDKASDQLTTEMMRSIEWQRRAVAAETAYAEQSKRMSAIVSENQKLRRSNAQLISRGYEHFQQKLSDLGADFSYAE